MSPAGPGGGGVVSNDIRDSLKYITPKLYYRRESVLRTQILIWATLPARPCS